MRFRQGLQLLLALHGISHLPSSTLASATSSPPATLSTAQATDEPLDLYGRHPSAEAIVANSTRGLDALRPPGTSWTNHTRFLPADRTTLAFVTPWHQPAGRDNVEWYRGKLDMVSPAWYTVEVVPESERVVDPAFEGSGATGNEYRIKGGVPTQEDREWLARIQSPVTPEGEGEARELPALKVLPRFQLDGWRESDYRTLRSDPLRWLALIGRINKLVDEGRYDGVVFESAASWLFPEFVQQLGTNFRERNQTLVVVFQPLRPLPDEPDAWAQLSAAIRMLAEKVDYVQIMTYDWAPNGVPVDFDRLGLAPTNPLREDPDAARMRTPAPNQPRSFLVSNIESLAGAGAVLEGEAEALSLNRTGTGTGSDSDSDSTRQQGAAEQAFPGADPWTSLGARTGSAVDPAFARKFLMGVPLYGYAYPLMWLDARRADPLPRVPTGAPPRARAALAEAQAAQRAAARRKARGKFALLRRASSVLLSRDVERHMRELRPLTFLDDDADGQGGGEGGGASDEMRYDYVLPNDDPEAPVDEEGRREGIYHRAFVPSAYSMIARREAIDEGGTGMALWDIGQASPWLLHAL